MLVRIAASQINFSAYINATTAFSQSSSGYAVQDVTYCDNGAIIRHRAGTADAWMMLAKTNNDGVMVIMSPEPTATSFCAICWGDTSLPSTWTDISFTAQARNVSQLVPFVSRPPLDNPCYTPNAFYIPFGQNYNLGTGGILVDADTGDRYISNGYWAILDGGTL